MQPERTTDAEEEQVGERTDGDQYRFVAIWRWVTGASRVRKKKSLDGDPQWWSVRSWTVLTAPFQLHRQHLHYTHPAAIDACPR